MNPKFKIGRSVICVKPVKTLKEGRKYQVLHSRFDKTLDCFVYRVLPNDDKYYRESRFKAFPVKIRKVV
jgi:hypothetical protein